jgi:hypothetical protein
MGQGTGALAEDKWATGILVKKFFGKLIRFRGLAGIAAREIKMRVGGKGAVPGRRGLENYWGLI